MDKRDDPQHRWMRGLATRMHPHIAVCALANKLVRISWALPRKAEAVFNQAGAAARSVDDQSDIAIGLMRSRRER